MVKSTGLNTSLEKRNVLQSYFKRLGANIKKRYQLYLFVLPAVLVIFIFKYIPMYGIVLAFKDFSPFEGIMGSEWVGFEHFIRFFRSYHALRTIRNTVLVSFYQIIAGFPVPVLFALVLNQISHARYKKLIQTVTYIPHFISTVVLVGMMFLFFSPRVGIYASLARILDQTPINVMAEADLFRHLYVLSGIWQNTGFASIIFLAALTAISQDLYEAATIDGASKWQKIIHIDIPSIMPTVVILLILRTGRMMNVGFEKVFLMQNSLNSSTSEVISTFVYKSGLLNAQYSYSTAIGLFNNIINFLLLVFVNRIAKKFSQTSLW